MARNNLKLAKDRIGNLDMQKCITQIKLSNVNVLVPDCTNTEMYDMLYCDCCITDDDLPAFLALVKPQGEQLAPASPVVVGL